MTTPSPLAAYLPLFGDMHIEKCLDAGDRYLDIAWTGSPGALALHQRIYCISVLQATKRLDQPSTGEDQ
jgi:hypothetical protein